MTPRVPPNMQPPRRTLALALLAACASAAQADTITIGDTHHDNVYITESAALYYISDPETGSTISIAKDDPALGSVEISDDPELREELLARYKDARDRQQDATRAVTVTPQNVIESIAHSTGFTTTEPAQRSIGRTVPMIVARGDRPVRTVTATGPTGTAAGQRGGFGGAAAGNTMGGGRPGVGGSFGETGGGRGVTGGAGGRGGGNRSGAGGQRTGAGFSNISGLFNSVDDASVGESRNPITGR